MFEGIRVRLNVGYEFSYCTAKEDRKEYLLLGVHNLHNLDMYFCAHDSKICDFLVTGEDGSQDSGPLVEDCMTNKTIIGQLSSFTLNGKLCLYFFIQFT